MGIKFNFYGFEVRVESESLEILDLLKKNFSYFYNKKDSVKESFKLEVIISDNLDEIIPKKLISTNQTINSITYEQGSIRYNDYYNCVVSKLDYTSNRAQLFGNNINRLHEVAYLIILSRQGKWSDQNSLHKVHAMAVNKDERNLIVMMPMKGGKTTLFTKFIDDESINLISDDTPMINNSGEVLSFPIRFGLENVDRYKELLASIEDEYKFKLNREQFGTKILVDTEKYKNRLGRVGEKNILIQGVRWRSDKCVLEKISKLRMLWFLKNHLIVGVGLPMVIEYFLENTIKDHFVNSKILLSRCISAINLVRKSESYICFMGHNVDENYNTIKKLLL